jgi:glycosyltransferase involved in cell wall biosynthesis
MTRGRSNPEVSFITWSSDSEPFGRIARWLAVGFEELGRSFDQVHLQEPAGISSRGSIRSVSLGRLRARASIPAIYRYLCTAKPRLALVAPGHISPFAVAAGRLAGIAVVPWEVTFMLLDLPERDPYLRVLPLLQRVTYRWAPLIAVVSQDVGTYCIGTFGGKRAKDIFELPNPVNPDEIRAAAADGATPTADRVRFVAAGRLAHQKGFDVLVEAMALASSKILQPWELVILGDGPRRADLDRLIQLRGLADRIHMPGYSTNPYREIAAADVFVHPARWEGFGVVLTEAMCLGVPVITTDSRGGPRQIIDGGAAGLLVPPDDPAALAEGIVRLASDSSLRIQLREKGLERVEVYGPAAVASRLLVLADRVEQRTARTHNRV